MIDSEVLLSGAKNYLRELEENKVTISTFYTRIKRAKGKDNLKYVQLKLALILKEVRDA